MRIIPDLVAGSDRRASAIGDSPREHEVNGAWHRRVAAARGSALLLPGLVALLALFVATLTITPWPVGVFEDDGIYTVLGKALATGEGYRMINLPGAPHATHYPPGYPFFLSLLWRLAPSFPDNIVVFKFANAVLLSLAAVGAYLFGCERLRLSPFAAAVTAMAGTLSITVLLVTGVVLSEPLFMCLLLPALLVVERSAEKRSVPLAAIGGALLGAAALVRTIGAVAIPAALVVLLLRRHVRAAVALAAAAALLLVPWQIWVTAYQHEIPPVLAGKYGAYGPWVVDAYREGGLEFALKVAQLNMEDLAHLLGYLFLPLRWTVPTFVASACAAGLILGGLFAARRQIPVTGSFLALYGLVVLLWPYDSDRFVLPLWPLLTIALASSGRALWQWAPSRTPVRLARWVALGLFGGVLAGHAWYNVRGYRQQRWALVQRDAGTKARPFVEWVARYTRIDDVVSTEHDLIVYLYTGRRGVPVSAFVARERVHPLTSDDVAGWVETIIDTYQPRFYITSWDKAQRAADDLARRVPPAVRLVGNTGNARVYQRIVPLNTP
jgi:hypothetical protein